MRENPNRRGRPTRPLTAPRRTLRHSVLAVALGSLLVSSGASAKTELTFLLWQDDKAGPIWKEIFKGFEAEHPDITINAIINPEDYQAKAKLMMDSGLLDLAMIDYIFFPSWALAQYLTPLDPYIARDHFDLQNLWPASLQAVRYHGKQYALPMDVNDEAMFYNTRLFDQAGVAYPDESWTWTTFFDAARKLTRSDGAGKTTQYAFGMPVYWEPLAPWVWNAGGDWVNADRNRLTLNQPPAVEAIQFLADLVNVYHASPSDLWAASDLFVNQKLALYGMGYWEISRMRATPGLDWDVAPLPYKMMVGGKPLRSSTLGGVSVGIPASSKHKEAAWEFIKYRLKKEVQLRASTLGLSMPATREAATDPAFLHQNGPAHLGVFVDALAYTRPFPTFPKFEDIDENVVSPAITQIWQGKSSAKQSLEVATQKGNGILQNQPAYNP